MLKTLGYILLELLRWLLPEVLEESKPTLQDSKGNTERDNAIQEKIRKEWGLGLLLVCLLSLAGCGYRVVYVPNGTAVRLRETIKEVDVWVLDENGTPVPSTMNIPEGWFATPYTGDED